MGIMSLYMEKKVLDKMLRGVDFTLSTVYVSLHTSNPGITGAGEVAGGSYARQAVGHSLWNAAATASDTGSECTNNATITFASIPASTLTYVGIWDAVSGGNFLIGGAFQTPIAVGGGGSFVFNAGQLAAKVI